MLLRVSVMVLFLDHYWIHALCCSSELFHAFIRTLIKFLLKQPYMDAEALAFDQSPDDIYCPIRSHLHPVWEKLNIRKSLQSVDQAFNVYLVQWTKHFTPLKTVSWQVCHQVNGEGHIRWMKWECVLTFHPHPWPLPLCSLPYVYSCSSQPIWKWRCAGHLAVGKHWSQHHRPRCPPSKNPWFVIWVKCFPTAGLAQMPLHVCIQILPCLLRWDAASWAVMTYAALKSNKADGKRPC